MHRVVGEERSLGTSCDEYPEGGLEGCDIDGNMGVRTEIH